jgi:hypothetical protein
MLAIPPPSNIIDSGETIAAITEASKSAIERQYALYRGKTHQKFPVADKWSSLLTKGKI